MPNKWTDFVKSFASKNGMNYRDALKCPECKAEYRGSGLRGTTPQVRPNEMSGETISISQGGSVGHLEEKVEQAKQHIRRRVGKRPVVSAVQDIAGNWIMPPIETANEMLSMKHTQPSYQSHKHLQVKAGELATNISNLDKHLSHTPLTPAPKKQGRGRPKKIKEEPIQLSDSAYISAEQDNLGLGANAGKHYLSL